MATLDDAVSFVKNLKLEQDPAKYKTGVHSDGIGVPTIGYGYALLVKNSAGKYARRETYDSRVGTITEAIRTRLGAIADKLNGRPRDVVHLANRNAEGSETPRGRKTPRGRVYALHSRLGGRDIWEANGTWDQKRFA